MVLKPSPTSPSTLSGQDSGAIATLRMTSPWCIMSETDGPSGLAEWTSGAAGLFLGGGDGVAAGCGGPAMGQVDGLWLWLPLGVGAIGLGSLATAMLSRDRHFGAVARFAEQAGCSERPSALLVLSRTRRLRTHCRPHCGPVAVPPCKPRSVPVNHLVSTPRPTAQTDRRPGTSTATTSASPRRPTCWRWRPMRCCCCSCLSRRSKDWVDKLERPSPT